MANDYPLPHGPYLPHTEVQYPDPGLYQERFASPAAIAGSYRVQRVSQTPAPAQDPYPQPAIDPQYDDFLRTGQVGWTQMLSQPAPYGRTPEGPLHAPLPYQDYHRSASQWPPIETGREWVADTLRLEALGFYFERPLGSGAFGEVWLVRDSAHGDRQLAAKILKIAHFQALNRPVKETLAFMLRDVDTLRGLSHQNIVCIETVIHIRDETTGFPTLFAVVMMGLCDGDLTTFINSRPAKRLYEEAARDWFVQVAAGLCYVHSNRVAHMDIKPDNVLYVEPQWAPTGFKQFKLADFGLAQVFPTGTDPMVSSEHGGTSFYMAPEMRHVGHMVWALFGQSDVDVKACDVYSLGVSLAESLIGTDSPTGPYKGLLQWSPGLNARQWVDHKLCASGLYPGNHPLIELLRGMLEMEPTQRLTIEQVVSHRWCVGERRGTRGGHMGAAGL